MASSNTQYILAWTWQYHSQWRNNSFPSAKAVFVSQKGEQETQWDFFLCILDYLKMSWRQQLILAQLVDSYNSW